MYWKEENNKLVSSLTFKDFVQAFAFMSEVAIHAEKMNHHPTWTNTYNKIDFQLSTHDAGDIVTQKDKDLASIIDKIFIRYQ
ncbi:MAG TPA: 4a-hydroxytetrahydrobiopterin dehydratase [Saprospiraceae bacterium]|nr:4a-hydroxytetrahydrobiopterin dehydratase [Saprospiraceae bacterium]HMU02287.1 4a-hydroxytetrahydrobiopterin dehydratase [Saprospiraceae bacterium]